MKALEGPLWRALLVFRIAALGYAAVLMIGNFRHYYWPLGGWLVLSVMAAWTVVSSLAYARPERRGWPLLTADLAVTACCLLSTRWIVQPDGLGVGAPTLPMAWVASPVVAWAISGGRRRGAIAALLMSVADVVVRDGFSQATVNGPVLMLLAGVGIGHIARLAIDAEARLQRATELEAATRERERLARGIHDSVLQVLALLQRRGAELGGEAAELGRLAGEQEATLRALVTSSGPLQHSTGRSTPASGRRPFRLSRAASVSAAGPPPLRASPPAATAAVSTASGGARAADGSGRSGASATRGASGFLGWRRRTSQSAASRADTDPPSAAAAGSDATASGGAQAVDGSGTSGASATRGAGAPALQAPHGTDAQPPSAAAASSGATAVPAASGGARAVGGSGRSGASATRGAAGFLTWRWRASRTAASRAAGSRGLPGWDDTGHDLVDLRTLLDRHNATGVSVATPATEVLLPAPVAAEVAAAVAAAVDNVHLHAGPAAKAWLLVEELDDTVTITIRDNGPGIPDGRLAEAEQAGRLGVAQSIRGRIRDLGGTTIVTSSPTTGTEIELQVPR
ncbi:hypothetical protein GCM10009827_103660 [Dactylosporangium maewongense]|uniref:Signal transduction histidine kinase n=1 Tax=Dactylosporangium maewongense TaxID=634393 RepID=A0ABP4NSK2_9ACTN